LVSMATAVWGHPAKPEHTALFPVGATSFFTRSATVQDSAGIIQYRKADSRDNSAKRDPSSWALRRFGQ
jgi:hypothetical protein